jgi:hypothetical protein
VVAEERSRGGHTSNSYVGWANQVDSKARHAFQAFQPGRVWAPKGSEGVIVWAMDFDVGITWEFNSVKKGDDDSRHDVGNMKPFKRREGVFCGVEGCGGCKHIEQR